MKRIFVDMDGTLAKYPDDIQDFFQKGYFKNVAPNASILEAVRELSHKEEVYVLSAVLSDSAEGEKDDWLDRYLPEVDKKHRIYVPYGANKSDFIPGGLRPDDILIDDYGKNLREWHGIRLKVSRNKTDARSERHNFSDAISSEHRTSTIKRKVMAL